MNIEIIVQDKKILKKDDTIMQNTLKNCEHIIEKLRQNICRKYPILNNAVFMMEFIAVKEDVILETNGKQIFYSPRVLKKMVKRKEMKQFENHYLHILLHGMLNHFVMAEEGKDDFIYHTLYDLEVKQILETLYIEQKKNLSTAYISSHECVNIFDFQTTSLMKMHKQLAKQKNHKAIMHEMRKKCRVDDHYFWGKGKQYKWLVEIRETNFGKTAQDNMSAKDFWGMIQMMGNQKGTTGIQDLLKEMSNGRIEEKNEYGLDGWENSENVKAKKEAKQNYRSVLKRYFKMREVVKEDAHSIDKGLYSWGFSEYGDVAFVEPEDENEQCTLSTVVIAVDTSGSCSGAILEQFLAELRQMFFELSNLHFKNFVVLQCDAQITKEHKFHNKKDFPRPQEFENMEMRGFGGTDFTPVFSYVDSLLMKEKVDCLIYLSDGYGAFPESKPENYETFFVLPYDNTYAANTEILPEWVHTLTMKVEE